VSRLQAQVHQTPIDRHRAEQLIELLRLFTIAVKELRVLDTK
jgi:hypothetical protein